MSWSTFLTYLAQAGILLIFVFVGTALVSAILDGLKKSRDESIHDQLEISQWLALCPCDDREVTWGDTVQIVLRTDRIDIQENS